MRKGVGAIRVPGADLAQDRDQGVPYQAVHLVEEQDDGEMVFLGPAGEQALQGTMGAEFVKGFIDPCPRPLIVR